MPRNHERRGGIEHDDVALRATRPAEHATNRVGVLLWRTAAQISIGRASESQIERIDREGALLTVAEFPHLRRTARRQLVQAVTVNDPGAGHAASFECTKHRRCEARVGHADQLVADAAGVRHRTDEVEGGRHTHLPAWRAGEAEGRVEGGCEAEADAGLADACGDALRCLLDRDAQQLQNVGRSTLRRSRPVPVLAHRRSGTRSDDRRHRRHVDRMRPVATRPDHVDSSLAFVIGQRDDRRLGHRSIEHAGQLVHCFALGTQRHQEPSDLRCACVSGEDRRHRSTRDIGGEVVAGDQCADHDVPAALVIDV